MYVVLDTNLFTADKQFKNSFWRLIGTRPKRWGLHVAVPWPVVQEAIANRRRDLAKALADLNTALSGAVRQGVPVSADEAIRALQSEIDGYEDWFEGKLKSLRIDVLPADVDHAETVRRAVNRLPPCDSKGDGYRDTLNWLTLLRLVEQNGDQDVVWVSNDTDFFETTDPLRLHQNLIEDLAALGAADRVSCRRDLAQAQALLIEKHQLDAAGWKWPTLQERVAELVVAELNTTEHVLDPIVCGLPLRIKTAHAVLESAAESGAATVTNLEADTEDQDRVLPFEVTFDAQCRMIQYSGIDGEATIGQVDDGSQEIVPKQLVASGTICVAGQTHEVTDVVIDKVAGAADDPDVLRNLALIQRVTRMHSVLDSLAQDSVAKFAGQQSSVANLIADQMGPQPSVVQQIIEQHEKTWAKVVGPRVSAVQQIIDQQELLTKWLGPQPSVVQQIIEQHEKTWAKVVGPRVSAVQQIIDQQELLTKWLGPQPSVVQQIIEQHEKTWAKLVGQQSSVVQQIIDQLQKPETPPTSDGSS